MAGQHPDLDPAPAFDAYDYLKIVLNPDGTITRGLDDPTTPAVPDPDHPVAVRTKDVPLDPTHNTWARIYVPRASPPPDRKLPLIVYYHGGGFILFSPSSAINQNLCSLVAAKLGAVVVSPATASAPAHRLPAAYDDAMEALRWVRTAEEEWLRERVDFSRCFLMGSSAGGNIAYHAGLRACAAAADLDPLVIRGLILHHPFFGGSQRTESEVRLFNNPVLPVNVADVMWELALPAGADRDHEYCNPMAGERSEEWERMRRQGWRVVVAGGGGDPLVDRQRELTAEMEAKGVEVAGFFGGEGDYHGVEVLEPAKAELFVEKLKGIV
ncbi:probable carboxylesterase 120 [Rhodamnia argentea]|uniref:Probable carboxylesterase 120 n=1 Tax=Rhodamnia argentea TaxID=178133 RepID=A0A8B8QU11_9MYRT|nr:probable carboxylesterase 120 [Rhodamnia argentea]